MVLELALLVRPPPLPSPPLLKADTIWAKAAFPPASKMEAALSPGVLGVGDSVGRGVGKEDALGVVF